MNRISIILIAFISILGLRAQNETPGQWRLHNTWDYYTGKVIDTKDRTFFLMMGQGYYDNTSWTETSNQLFVYEKQSDELIPYNAVNYLHGNIIQHAAYNARKGYLLLVYDDYSIDLLYDDDTVFNVPGLSTAVLTSSKNVNNVTFDPENDRAYLATDFGYLVIDDKQNVITESRIYDIPLTGICRVGDHLLASTSSGLYISPLADRHSTWASFSQVSGISEAVRYIIPLDGNKFMVSISKSVIGTVEPDGSVTFERVSVDNSSIYQENRDGYYIKADWFGYNLKRDGSVSPIIFPADLRGIHNASWDAATCYFSKGRDGFCSLRYNAADNTWQQLSTRPVEFLQPYKIFHICHSPEYGMIVGNESYNRFLTPMWVNYRELISMYKDGGWTSIGGAVNTASPFSGEFRNCYGPVIDPNDPDALWVGGNKGLFKITLPDNGMMIYSYPNGPGKGKPGFHSTFPDVFDGSNHRCTISTPSFDADGTMWLGLDVLGASDNDYSPIYYWPAADRLADNTSALKAIPLPGYSKAGGPCVINALRHSSNRNTVIFAQTLHYEGGIYILNHNGTPDNPADDKVVHLTKLVDQNGNGVPFVYTNCIWEDPATGTVWVGTSTSLYTFRPSDVLAGNTTVRRIIVSRNDGTNQGDYLLDGNDVYHINADGAGRKWFSTIGNGVIVTSASGDEIVKHFTTANSMLPSDDVYCTGFDPGSNAVWIGTGRQLATYYSDVTPGEADYDHVVSYPNPVRPDFYGEVTIQGLMDQSLVKIIDQGGNLVKELGRSQGGMITWDLTDVQGRRVSTGIYIIAASTETSASASVGKILVVK